MKLATRVLLFLTKIGGFAVAVFGTMALLSIWQEYLADLRSIRIAPGIFGLYGLGSMFLLSLLPRGRFLDLRTAAVGLAWLTLALTMFTFLLNLTLSVGSPRIGLMGVTAVASVAIVFILSLFEEKLTQVKQWW